MSASSPDEIQVERLLSPLRTAPARAAEAAAGGRAKFLAEAKNLRPAVSAGIERRHKGWIHIFSRKEPIPMTTVASILLAVSLLFGGAGATVYAAQDSTPGQILYPLKLAGEDARLGLTTRAQARLELALEYSTRRAAEAAGQLQAGDALQSRVIERWQQELRVALDTAAGLPDDELSPALRQIQLAVQEQQRRIDRAAAPINAEADRQRIHLMLRDCQELVTAGLRQPDQFRQRVRQTSDEAIPPVQPSQGAGGGSPWTTGTPTPGSSYGPGGQNPWTTGTPTPDSSYGPGGQNPWTTGTPTPGSGYGPGTGPGLTCTPGSGPGLNATQPGGNPDPGPSNPDPRPSNPDPGPNNPGGGPGSGKKP